MSGCGCQGWTRNQVIHEDQEQQESKQQQVQVPPQVQEDVPPQHSQLHLRHVRYYNTEKITPCCISPPTSCCKVSVSVRLLHPELQKINILSDHIHQYMCRQNRVYFEILRNCLNVAPNINCTNCHNMPKGAG